MVVALVVVTAGCDRGSDGGDGASATTAAGEATTTAPGGTGETTTSGPAAPTGDPRLEDVVLRQSDFPAGWTSEPSDDAGQEEADAAMERCLGIEVSTAERPRASSPDFSVGDAITQASSAVERAPDRATVDREYAAITGPKFLGCVQQQFDAAIAREAAGAQFAPAKADRLTFPSQGDGTAAVRLTTTLSAEGQQVPFVADLVFVRKGVLELSFSFINAGGPFDAALAADLVGKVVARA